MLKSFLMVILMHAVTFIHAQGYQPPVPDGFAPYTFIRHDTTYVGHYFIGPFHIEQVSPYDRALAILDEQGYILWYYSEPAGTLTNFKFHQKNTVMSFTSSLNSISYNIVMDTGFNPIDTILPSNVFERDGHEFQVLENGHYIIDGRNDSIVDLSAYTLNGAPGSDTTHIRSYAILEYDGLSHNLLFHWNSNDHINPLESYDEDYGYDPGHFDYCHGNAIEKDHDGNYLVSFRHLNAIYKVDSSTGNVIWRLGGKSSDFTFPNDAGFSGQHDVRRLDNGYISLFDNANSAPLPRYSRAVQYLLDTINWTATKVWEYSYTTPFHARAMGNYQATDNGHHLVSYGFSDPPHPSLVLVDDAEDIVSEIFFKDSVYTYRSFTFQLPPISRPPIECTAANQSIILSASNQHQKYLWSTGDTTASITVVDTGVYQVWVNKGIGMIGSKPVHISNIEAFCSEDTTNVGIAQPAGYQNVMVDAIFDLLGRSITNPQVNQLYIVRYENGLVRKTFWKGYNRLK